MIEWKQSCIGMIQNESEIQRVYNARNYDNKQLREINDKQSDIENREIDINMTKEAYTYGRNRKRRNWIKC